MLVLTRKKDETIKIGNDIVIRVIKTGPTSIKLGIEAPTSVRVVRGELAELLADPAVASQLQQALEPMTSVVVDLPVLPA